MKSKAASKKMKKVEGRKVNLKDRFRMVGMEGGKDQTSTQQGEGKFKKKKGWAFTGRSGNIGHILRQKGSEGLKTGGR